MLDLLPYAAFVASLLAVAASALHVRGNLQAKAWSQWAVTAATVFSLAAFFALVVLFIRVETVYQYVFLYTSSDVPLRYRIAGTWAGREGSLLLWSTLTGVVAVAFGRWRHNVPDAKSVAWSQLVLTAVTAAFMGAVAFQGTFAATDDFLLRNRPGGNGLNPTLLNPFILIHPPLMFVAYALTAVPLAAVVADQITGAQAWSRIGMMWSRINWLLYTAAMGLGGIWAYYTLGFGGYWAWDPVEVANLLPWLALTLFLHVQLHHRRYGGYVHLGPLLGVLPFLLTLFSTISTRSGLWISVHAFTDPTGTFDPDAASRMLQILAQEPGLQFPVGLFLAVLAAFLALWSHRIAKDTGIWVRVHRVVAGILGALAVVSALQPTAVLGALLEASVRLVPGHPGFGLLAITVFAVLAPAVPLLIVDEPSRKPRLDMRTFGVVATAVLGTGLLILFLWHMVAVNGWSSSLYYNRFPLLATPVLLGLLVFQSHAIWRRRALWIAGGLLAVAAVVAIPFGVTGYLLVLTTALVAISVYRVSRASGPATPALHAARTGMWLAALLNVLFWLNPPTIRLGVTWQPQWPTQLIMGTIALISLHLATRLLAGDERRSGATHFLVGALGAYYVAPVVAALSWMAHRKAAPAPAKPGRALHQIGLYGIHLSVAIALLGYTTSTYLATEVEQELGVGQTMDLGGTQAELLEIGQEGTFRIDRILPRLAVTGASTAETTAVLYWEPQSSSHYPLPATARMWDRDVYFAVTAVCVDPAGVCEDRNDWIRAYELGSQLPAGVTITKVQLQGFDLPGLSMVWGALLLWLYFMGLIMVYGPERP